jgi:hypothetical protein
MSRNKGLGGLYNRLTPEERFRLFVEAEVREDKEECRRLVQSCPQRIYEMNDPAYEDRLRASQEATILVCLDLAPRLAKARLIGAFSEALVLVNNSCLYEADYSYFEGHRAGAKVAWRAAGRDGDPPVPEEEYIDNTEMEQAFREITARVEESSNRFTAFLGDLKHQTIAEAGAIWEAFGIFSRSELGIEPEKLMKVWFEPMLEEVEWLGTFMANTKPNREKLAEYQTALSAIWHQLVRDQ